MTVLTKATGVSVALKGGDTILDGTEVVTSPGAEAILVFSNGASVDVAADSTLDIDEFQQDPFASDQKVSEMTQEPTTSVTKLNLTKGELVGKVVHLNVDRGSEFTVDTPVGAAGIRGTTFRIIFRPDPNNPGKAFFSVVTAEGVVVLHGSTTAVSIPAGKQVVVATFTYTPPSTTGGTGGTGGTSGGGTGGTGTGTVSPVTLVTSDISTSDAASILSTAQTIVTTNLNVIISNSTSSSAGTGATGGTGGTGGTGNGNGNGTGTGNGNGSGSSDNTPSTATPATQNLTPGA